MSLVSVVMPVYNAEAYLSQAIESILNQSYTNLEFIILNDGSTDSSSAIIESYKDSRIRYLDFLENVGYPTRLNQGIDESQGIYIARMDADDISKSDRIKQQVNFLDNHPQYILCGTNYTILDKNEISNLPLENDDIKLKLLYLTTFCHPTVMFRKAVLKNSGLKYDVNKIPAEDHDLWVRLSKYGLFHNLEPSLLEYRIHNNNISHKKRTEFQNHQLQVSQKEYIGEFFQAANLSLEEISLLHQLFFKEMNYSIRDLEAISQVVQKIKKLNLSYSVPIEMVQNMLNERFFYRCTTSTQLGLKVFRLAYRLSGGKYLYSKMLKLLIKSMLRFQAH